MFSAKILTDHNVRLREQNNEGKLRRSGVEGVRVSLLEKGDFELDFALK